MGKAYKKLLAFIALFVCFGLTAPLTAQLTVTPVNNGQTLANNITANGVIVSNVTFNCPTDAAGTFNGTNSNIGLGSGVLLTTGQANLAVGPNSSGSTGNNNLGNGDPVLDSLSGVMTFDACILEFDLVPYCDTVQIRYVFGSDEYDEYVCASVNDVFAFLISGPGYPAPTNIAVVPGTNIPVAINSVNNGSVGANGTPNGPGCNLNNSQYFVTNNNGVTIEYDGFTTVLSAFAPVQACQTYHLKLAIADGGDGIFDSGVFLELNGISCTSIPQFISVDPFINHPTSTVLVEDCIDGGFEFNRGGDISQSTTVNYQVQGSATNGGDFLPLLTGSVTFPANVASVSIPIDPVFDGITEGLEDVIVIVQDSLCFGSQADTAILIIDDLPPSDAGPDLNFCAGDTGQLQGVPVTNATYEWIPAIGLSNPNIPDPEVTLTQGGTFAYTFNVSLANGCVSTDTALVVIQPRPDIAMYPDASFCEGEGGAQIGAVASGGVAPLYYNWWCDSTATFCGLDSAFDDDPFANPTVSTWYYAQITGSNGCLSAIDSIFVEVLPKPIVDAGPDLYICPDSAPGVVINPTISNATGPYTYQWSPALGLNDATILNPYARPDTTTIYSLVVTAGNGCSSELTTIDTNATVSVIVNPLPVAIAHLPADEVDICFGDSINLQGAGAAAGPDYTFQYSPVNGLSNPNVQSPMASPALTTEYVLTVFSNGCPSAGDTVRVVVHPQPTIDAGVDFEICLGEEGQLDGEVDVDNNDTYVLNWSPTNGIIGPGNVPNPIVSPDTTTTYVLTAFSEEWGCYGTPDSVTVNVNSTPIAEAGPNLSICDGDSIVLNGSFGYTTTLPAPINEVYYSWNPNQSMSDSTVLDPTVWPGQSIFYTLTVSHENCATTDTMLVTVNPMPIAAVVADTNVICGGDSIQLTASGGIGNASFTWIPANGLDDPASADPMASPDVTTLYSIIVEENGCIDSTEIEIEVIPRPVPAFVQSQIRGCAPFSVNFQDLSTDALNWVWNFGDDSDISNLQNPEHEYSDPGSYDVTLTAIGPGGCSAVSDPIRIEVGEAPIAEFTSDPSFPVELYLPSTEVQFQNLSQFADSYTWNFGDGTASDLVDPMHFFKEPGTYYVRLLATDEYGCSDTILHGPYVVLAPDLFIPNVFSPNDDDINDRFIVEYNGSQPFDLQIFDRWGVRVYQSKNKVQGWNGMDEKGSAVTEGVYFYRLVVGDKEYAGEITLVR